MADAAKPHNPHLAPPSVIPATAPHGYVVVDSGPIVAIDGHNTAVNISGGISNACGGTVTMTDSSQVKFNIAGVDAGGIGNFGTLTGVVAGVIVASNIPNDIGP